MNASAEVNWALDESHARLFTWGTTSWITRAVEILLIYVDVVVSGIVLLSGIWHYIVEVIRGDS
jgi:hypothetical protein